MENPDSLFSKEFDETNNKWRRDYNRTQFMIMMLLHHQKIQCGTMHQTEFGQACINYVPMTLHHQSQ